MNKGRKAFAKGMLGLALLGAVIYLANPVQLWGRLQQANPWWLLAGFGFAIASNAVSAWRWRAMAVWLGVEMPMASAMRWYFQAIGLNVLLPGAVVGGVLIAQALAGKEVDQQELLHIMTRIEGHPDNVAPCFLGGMTVSCWDGSELRYVRLPSLPEDMHVVVAVPDVRVKTSDAREALPESVGFKDAVFTLGRAALLTAAWATGKWDLLSWGMDDKLHQQYRAKLFPGGEVILDRVRQVPGCLATSIRGSGPSVLALVRGKPRRVAEAMCSTFSEHGVRSLFFVLDGNGQGAHLELSLDFKSERERIMR